MIEVWLLRLVVAVTGVFIGVVLSQVLSWSDGDES